MELDPTALAHIKVSLQLSSSDSEPDSQAPRSPPASERTRFTSHTSSRWESLEYKCNADASGQGELQAVGPQADPLWAMLEASGGADR